MLPHLHSGYAVDQAIENETDRLVVIRFGRDWSPECMQMDEVLYSIAHKVKNFAVIYLVRFVANLYFVAHFLEISSDLSSHYRLI